jgi:hypothetical protein
MNLRPVPQDLPDEWTFSPLGKKETSHVGHRHHFRPTRRHRHQLTAVRVLGGRVGDALPLVSVFFHAKQGTHYLLHETAP